MSNGSWKKYGGVSKLNSFNIVNTSAIIADQFISRSTTPAEQTFSGTLEVTVDIKAGNDLQSGNNCIIGNSLSTKRDIYVNGNTYINQRLFFFSTDPSSDLSTVDISFTLPLDTSHAYIAGDVSNIGVNILHPKSIFHISCDVSNVTDILTVESSGTYIRSIMSQTQDKMGIVFDASNEESNMKFFNGGIDDTSTNVLNTPTAYIKHLSGGYLTARTSNTIDISAGTFFVDTSGVNMKLDGSGVVLESSGSIIIDTSSSFLVDSSTGFLRMEAANGLFSIGASGDFRLISSVSAENIGAEFSLNHEKGFLSSSGALIFNASGGLIELNATNDGLIKFNSGGFNLNTILNIAPTGIDLSSSSMYDETLTIYGNKASTYLPDIYTKDVSTGNGAVIRSVDPSNNSNLRIVSSATGKGAQVTGGIYPEDSNQSMAVFGITDLSNGFTPNSMILSGTQRHNKRSTYGINTLKPLTDKYVLDVNGPMHVNNTEVQSVATSNFEYKHMHFSRSYPLSGIASGSPNSSKQTEHTQTIIFTSDGGKTWTTSDVYEQEDSNEPDPGTEDTNAISFFECFLSDLNYGIIAGDQKTAYMTKNGGKDWLKVLFDDITNTFTTAALSGCIKTLDTDDVHRFFNIYNESGVGYSKIKYFDISTNTIDTLISFPTGENAALTIKNDDTGNILSRDLISDDTRIVSITAADTSGQYLYIAGETGIDKINISTPIIQLTVGGSYPRKIADLPANSGITQLHYRDINVLNDTHVIAVGENLISTTTDGTNWSDISVNLINNIGDVSLNKAFLVDTSNAIVVGERGTVLYSYDWSNDSSWNLIPSSIISSGGTDNLVQDICNNLISVFMTNNGDYIVANNIETFLSDTLETTGRTGTSRIEYLTMPSLFHNTENFVLEVSGNIAATGDLILHKGTIVATKVDTDTNDFKLGTDSSYIHIGECLTPEELFTNIGDTTLGVRDLSENYKVINIGATNPSSSNDAQSYHINIGNPFSYNSIYKNKGHKIFIGGGDDIVVIDGSSVQFKSQQELIINSTHVILNAVDGAEKNSGKGCGIQIKSDNQSDAGFIESSRDGTGYLFKSPTGDSTLGEQNILKIDSSNSILHDGIITGLMVLREVNTLTTTTSGNIYDGSFVMQSANFDLSHVLIREPSWTGTNHNDYTEDVMQRINTGLFIDGDVSLNNNLYVEKDVQINGNLSVQQYNENNIIQTTVNNYSFLSVVEDMSLAGRLFVRDNISIRPSGSGTADSEPTVSLDLSGCTDAILVPAGTTAQRPNVQKDGVNHVDYKGYIRYNTEQDTFEGYGAGPAWGSLGGVIDVDQDTFITAEVNAGTDNDQLQFFTDGSLNMIIDKSGFVGIANSTPAALLDVSGILIHRGPKSESLTAELTENVSRPLIIGSPISNYKWGSDNTFIGMDSLTNFQYGSNFTVIGNETFQDYIGNSLVSGSDTYSSQHSSGNSAIGDNAGSGLSYGGYNTFLGAASGIETAFSSLNTTSNEIVNSTAVGNNAQIIRSNQIVLGGQSPVDSTYPEVIMHADLSCGGTAHIVGDLSCGGNTYITKNIANSKITDATIVTHPTGVDPVLLIGTDTTTNYTPIAQFITGTTGFTEINRQGIYHKQGTGYFKLYTDSNNVYLDSPAPSSLIYFQIAGVDKANINSSGQFEATSFNATSDARLKNNITPLNESLSKINQLQGVQFTWTEETSNNLNTGFIAQDVEKIMPEIVSTAQEKSQKGIYTKSINYNGVVPYLVESVKTLSSEIESLQNENKVMKEKMKQYDIWFAELLNK